MQIQLTASDRMIKDGRFADALQLTTRANGHCLTQRRFTIVLGSSLLGQQFDSRQAAPGVPHYSTWFTAPPSFQRRGPHFENNPPPQHTQCTFAQNKWVS